MKNVFLLLLFTMCAGLVYAQQSSPEVVSSAGESYRGNSVRLDWTLGELAVATVQNGSQQITQGFHQPRYSITSVQDLPEDIGNIRVYPNPSSDRIEMDFHFNQTMDIKIHLVDVTGRMIWSKADIGERIKHVKDIEHLTCGTYFLNIVIDDNRYTQTFKVKKIN